MQLQKNIISLTLIKILNGIKLEINMKLLSMLKNKCQVIYAYQNKKIIIFLYLLFLMPSALIIFTTSYKMRHLKALSDQILNIRPHIKNIIKKQKYKSDFFKKNAQIKQDHLDKILKTQTFLQHEIKILNLLYKDTTFKDCSYIKTNLHALTNKKNRLIFTKEYKQQYDNIRETHLKQKQTVEINNEDLKSILSLIEGTHIEENNSLHVSPQLIIKNFTLNKKNLSGKETFLLNMNVIKKEIIK
jgi:hypothetical protein